MGIACAGDQYVCVPLGNDPKKEMEDKINGDDIRPPDAPNYRTQLYPISPGCDDTMCYRRTPWVLRHEYGKRLMREWLRASQYAVRQRPGVSRIWLQNWDELMEGMCITETRELGKFYMNATCMLKRLATKYYGRGRPSPDDPLECWRTWARDFVCTLYWAVFGRGPVRDDHREELRELIRIYSEGQVPGDPDEAEFAVVKAVCYHRDNIKRWPPVISLDVQDVNNDIS